MLSSGGHGDRKVLAVCQLLVRIYEILDQEPMYLPTAAKQEIAKVGNMLSDLYALLAADVAAAGPKLWK